MHDFGALVAVAGAYDEEIAGVVRRILAQEPPDGPYADLAVRLLGLLPAEAGVPAQAPAPVE